MEIDINERSQRAVSYFADGYNCSQSVFMAYSDLYGIDVDLASKFATSFGGGMGRLREVCGAVSGMFMVASMHMPANNTDREAKKANYALVHLLADDFKKENGSIICRELLGLDPKFERQEKKRPCSELVRMAAEIVGRRIKGEETL